MQLCVQDGQYDSSPETMVTFRSSPGGSHGDLEGVTAFCLNAELCIITEQQVCIFQSESAGGSVHGSRKCTCILSPKGGIITVLNSEVFLPLRSFLGENVDVYLWVFFFSPLSLSSRAAAII